MISGNIFRLLTLLAATKTLIMFNILYIIIVLLIVAASPLIFILVILYKPFQLYVFTKINSFERKLLEIGNISERRRCAIYYSLYKANKGKIKFTILGQNKDKYRNKCIEYLVKSLSNTNQNSYVTSIRISKIILSYIINFKDIVREQ